MKKCGDVMTKNPVCCLPTDAVLKAAQLMRKENVGCILVVESEQTRKLIGILTDRDIVLHVVAGGRDAKSIRVADVMTHKIITCRVEDDILKVMDAMAGHQLRRMPVVDDYYTIVGIISQGDVATRAGEPEETGAMVMTISQPSPTQLQHALPRLPDSIKTFHRFPILAGALPGTGTGILQRPLRL